SHLGAAPSSARMARELSQEAVLDFLWGAGGRAPNSALLRHFQRFLRDPALTEQQRRERRECFKSIVNSLATVRPGAAASKDIVLRRRPDRSRSPPPPSGPGALPPDSSRAVPPPRSPAGVSLPKAPPPSAGPGGRRPTGASRSPRPPPSRSLPSQSAPGVLSLSRSLQELPATPSPPLFWGPDVLSPSQSRSLQQLPTGPPRSPPRAPRVLAPDGPIRSQVLLSHPCLPPPSDPGVLPPARPPPSRSPSQPSPPRSPQPPCQPSVPAAGSAPPAPLPVFRSIRCQLALWEPQGTPRSAPPRSSARGLPLGRREHAWLVAASAGCWARVRGLFLEEPELALQRDFVSGFTVLHWLAKHGDGPGLRELAAAARRAGLALDVDARSGCGYTALHLAAIHGHQLAIKVLVLQLGCQVRLRDGSGRRPWEYLGGSTSGEIWQLLEAP
ncbi:SWAHB protein, partial [Centropus bengalensis]|nr:SWAHB protein [Centropus bengalensis]